MNGGIKRVIAAVLWTSLLTATRLRAEVNLELRLVTPLSPLVGDTIQVGLFAVSDSPEDQPFSGIDALLDWDPAVLRLTGKADNGPFGFSSSSFPNDRNLDKLNADCGPKTYCTPYRGLPYNDGNAFFQVFVTSLDPAPLATPQGLLVTTLLFRAAEVGCTTTVTLLAETGEFSSSRVVIGEANGTLDLTGTLAGDEMTVMACGSHGDFDGDCRVTLSDHSSFAGCRMGPARLLSGPCGPADVDGDGDGDLRDAASLQRGMECP